MRRNFLVRGTLDNDLLQNILAPYRRGLDRATHKIIYRTTMGVVEYVSIPMQDNPGRYEEVGISKTLRKIILRGQDTIHELERLLRTNGVDIVEIVKDGPKTVELKRS